MDYSTLKTQLLAYGMEYYKACELADYLYACWIAQPCDAA